MRKLQTFIAAAATAALAGGLAAGLTGCATSWAPEPGFGQAVTNARAAQVINPDAPSRSRAQVAGDGQSAKSSIDRYQKSFETPPTPINVLNIGVGTGGGSGSQ